MISLIKRRQPNLNLIHLLAVDMSKYKYGSKAKKTIKAIRGMNDKIGRLSEAMEKAFREDYNLIIFSDHASLDVDRK